MAKYINTDLPFFDNSGAPLANGTVYFGVVNTNAKTSPRVPFLDQDLTVEAAAVQVLTSGGKLQQKLYLGGVYSVITDDVNGNQIAEDLSWSGIPEGIDSVLLPLSQNDIKQWPSVVGTTGTFQIDVNTDLYKTYVDEVGAVFEIDGDKDISDGFVAGAGFAVVWLSGASAPTVTIVGNGSLELPAGASPRPRVVGSTIYIHRAQTGQPVNNWFVTGDYEGLGASGSLDQTFISLDAGTEGAPAVRQTGDTDTGLYFPASNQVAITVAGSEVAAFTGSGLEVSADILAHRPSSSTKADLAVLNQDGGAIFTTHSSTTRISRTDNTGGSEQAILSHDGVQVALFSPAGITPGLKITGDQTQEVLRASGFVPIAAETTAVTFSSLQVVDQAALAIATLKIRNEDGGLALTADDNVAKLQRTDSTGTTISDFIFQNAAETRFHAPGITTATLLLDGEESQKVRRDGTDKLIAAENTTPAFAGALFTSSVVIDVPLPSEARLEVRNDEGGVSVFADDGEAGLWRTNGEGQKHQAPMISQTPAGELSLYHSTSLLKSFIIDGAESQKVRRAGSDQLIAAEGTTPEFDAVIVDSNSGITFNHPTLGTSNIAQNTGAGFHSLSFISNTDKTDGSWITAYANDDVSFASQIRMGFGDVGLTAAFAVTGIKKIQSWNQAGNIFNDVATIDDLSGATAVIDNLLSTSSTDALSANQGRVLQEGQNALTVNNVNGGQLKTASFTLGLSDSNKITRLTTSNVAATVTIPSDDSAIPNGSVIRLSVDLGGGDFSLSYPAATIIHYKVLGDADSNATTSLGFLTQTMTLVKIQNSLWEITAYSVNGFGAVSPRDKLLFNQGSFTIDADFLRIGGVNIGSNNITVVAPGAASGLGVLPRGVPFTINVTGSNCILDYSSATISSDGLFADDSNNRVVLPSGTITIMKVSSGNWILSSHSFSYIAAAPLAALD